MSTDGPGTLYLCATPIGNLGDMTFRAVETLRNVDLIAAEDTRHSRKLTSHFDIHVPLTSYHEHNRRTKGPELLDKLLAGKNIALVSDAGLPGISDPGEDLVRLAIDAGVRVVPIPGANAALTALVASGLATDGFLFVGFLPKASAARRTKIRALQNIPVTLLFYESPHQLAKTLADLLAVLGDRQAVIGRELTKLHEEIKKTTLGEAVAFYKDNDPRGEYVLVLAGTDPAAVEQAAAPTLEEAVAAARALQAGGLPPAAAAKQAAAGTPFSKGEIYKELIK